MNGVLRSSSMTNKYRVSTQAQQESAKSSAPSIHPPPQTVKLKIMNNHQLNYWIESVQSSLDDNDISLPPEKIEAIAKDMANSAECQGMAFGHDAISSPRNGELEELKKKYEAKIKELENRDYIFR